MKIRMLWAFAAAACLAACGKPAPVEETPADVPAAAAETAPATPMFDEAFIDHMHLHADHMDDLMFSLADGDLESAKGTAAWLARHGGDDRIPSDWQPYLDAMKAAARNVENAIDLETARTAAEQISVHCQECHAAAGVNKPR